MTQLLDHPAPATTRSTTLWRWAGGFTIAHVVLLFAGFSQEVAVEHGTSLDKLQSAYGGADIHRVFAGGYVESMAFVVLVPALVLLGRLFGRRTETGRIAAQTFVGLGLVYAASTLAVGFAPGAAAMYAAQHQVPIGTIAMVNDIRNYGFVLQVAVSVAMALALGVAARAERIHTWWVGVGGIAVGLVGLAATPLAHNGVSMVEMIWWLGVGIVCLRPTGSAD